MDRFEPMQTGGFPLETDTLNFIQDAYHLLQALGHIAGNVTIISGCAQIGTQIGDGVIFLNGELLKFKGGTVQERVVVVEDSETRNFEDGSNKIVYRSRYATFGNGHGSVAWANFVRLTPSRVITDLVERIEKLEKYCKPFTHGGASVLWLRPANEIPEGWEEDLDARQRMPFGWDPENESFSTLLATGGAASVALHPENNAPHTHTGVALSAGNHSHTYTKPSTFGRSGRDNGSFDFHNTTTSATSLAGSHEHTLAINISGEGAPFSIMNPYRIVIFIKPKIS